MRVNSGTLAASESPVYQSFARLMTWADAERQLMAETRPGLAEATAATGFPMPWRFFLEDDMDDNRAPEKVEKDVKDALVGALLEDSPILKSLQPGDMITLSVELVSRPQPWVRAKPTRTLVVRAKKSDLDAFAAGKVSFDDLLKRVQTQAY